MYDIWTDFLNDSFKKKKKKTGETYFDMFF